MMQGGHVAGAAKRKRADERQLQQKKASAVQDSLFAHAVKLLVVAICTQHVCWCSAAQMDAAQRDQAVPGTTRQLPRRQAKPAQKLLLRHEPRN